MGLVSHYFYTTAARGSVRLHIGKQNLCMSILGDIRFFTGVKSRLSEPTYLFTTVSTDMTLSI